MTSPDPTTSDLTSLAGAWTLDPGSTSIEFHTKAMWVLPGTGRLRAPAGSATAGSDGTVSGTLVLDAASIDTKNKKRDEHLRTADFFEAATFPTMVFTAAGGAPAAGGKVQLTGTFEAHGQSRPITVPAEVSVTGSTSTVTAEIDLDRSQWGLTWSKMGTELRNHVVVTARLTHD